VDAEAVREQHVCLCCVYVLKRKWNTKYEENGVRMQAKGKAAAAGIAAEAAKTALEAKKKVWLRHCV
jgi:hypothetical protein